MCGEDVIWGGGVKGWGWGRGVLGWCKNCL